MIRNYLKAAIRNIARNKFYTAVNVFGLSLGISACICIYLLYSYELSFDNFHPDRERIFRLMGDVTENTGNKLHFGRLPYPISRSAEKMPAAETVTGIIPYNASIIIPSSGRKFENMSGFRFITTAIVQPSYFDIFKFDWLSGSQKTSLNDPFQVVLTESSAKKYFGDDAASTAIGKQIVYDDSLTVTVTGVLKDWTGNSDLGFTDFISAATLQGNFLGSRIDTVQWAAHFMNTWTFAKLNKNASPADLETQLNNIVKGHASEDVKLKIWAEPLARLHFNPDVIESPIRTADKSTLLGLLTIAIFILILAIINFVNLATAQATQRAKEVSVRKLLGSSRRLLMIQFLVETFLLAGFALVLACLMVSPVLAFFHDFIPEGLKANVFSPATFAFLIALLCVISILAGLYPARLLSSFSPAVSLKGLAAHKGGEKWWLRKGLVVFQLAVSLTFIIGSLVISKQLAYTREKDRGFNSEAILVIPTPWSDSVSKIEVLKERLLQIPAVTIAAVQWLSPMTDNGRIMRIKAKSGDQQEIQVGQVAGDENFIPLYQIKLLAGRNLLHADSVREFVINRTFLHYLGYKNPADALNRQLFWNNKPYPIVGVVEDFHTASFHDPIKPLCIINRPDRQHTLAVKLATSQNPESLINLVLPKIEKEWKKLYPDGTFDFQLYDESLKKLYEKDFQAAKMINTAMYVAILISSIGLFGLILFVTARRSKEISIRKILGARVSQITLMIGRDFALLVLLAGIVASPVAWYFMSRWLNNFSYRINLGLGLFVTGLVVSLLLVVTTVAFHVIRAARVNPVKNLRSE